MRSPSSAKVIGTMCGLPAGLTVANRATAEVPSRRQRGDGRGAEPPPRYVLRQIQRASPPSRLHPPPPEAVRRDVVEREIVRREAARRETRRGVAARR